MSAFFSSSWVSLNWICLGNSRLLPSRRKGRHMAVSTPTFRRIFSAAWAARRPRSRYGFGLNTTFIARFPPMPRAMPRPELKGRRSRARPPRHTGVPNIRCCPLVPERVKRSFPLQKSPPHERSAKTAAAPPDGQRDPAQPPSCPPSHGPPQTGASPDRLPVRPALGYPVGRVKSALRR